MLITNTSAHIQQANYRKIFSLCTTSSCRSNSSPAVSHVFSQLLRSNFQGDAVWLFFFKDCWQWLWIMHAPEKPPIWSVHHHEQLININRDSAMVKTAAACFHRVAFSSAAFYVTAALLKTLNELKTPNKRVVLCTCIT